MALADKLTDIFIVDLSSFSPSEQEDLLDQIKNYSFMSPDRFSQTGTYRVYWSSDKSIHEVIGIPNSLISKWRLT